MPVASEHIRRYNEMPFWAQMLIRYEWIRTTALPLSPLVISLWLSLITPLALILGVLASGAYVYFALKFVGPKKVADKPGADDEEPQFAILEVLKLRLPITFDEGFCLIIPGISRIIPRSKEQWNEEFIVKGVGCRLEPLTVPGSDKPSFFEMVSYAFTQDSPADVKAGGNVTVTVAATMAIDHRNGWVVLEYDEAGEKPGVLGIIKDQIDQDVREMGRLLTWLQMKFATDLMSAHIIVNLAKPEDGSDTKTSLFARPTPETIQQYIAKVRVNGVSYMQGLGVKIKRLQITSVKGEGRLEEEAEKASIELLRAQGLERNVDGLVSAVAKLKAGLTDGSLSDRVALEAVLINDPDARITREIKDINVTGVDGPIAAAVTALVDMFRKDKK